MSRALARAWLVVFVPLCLLFEGSVSDSRDVEKEQFDALVAWMQAGVDKYVPEEHQKNVPRIADVLAINGRTVVAKRDMREGELLMRFPKERLMHAGYYKGGGSPINVAMDEALTKKIVYIAPQTWLALYMMEQQHLGKDSDWYPYLSFLPAEFPSNPIFYGEEEFKWIQGSTFVKRAKAHLTSLQTQFKTVSDLVPGFNKTFTLNEFLWARSAIATRVFGWELPGVERDFRDFMVPLGDMFNHRSPKQTVWEFNETSQTFDYWMRESVKAGEEFFISYGTKSNGEYLLHYGFTVAGLPFRNYTICSLKVALDLEGIPDQEAKRKWLIKASFSKVKDHTPAEFTLKNTWDKEPDRMLAHARLLMIDSVKEVEYIVKFPKPEDTCKRIAQPPNCPKPVSIENERAALQLCLEKIRKALHAYPSSFEDDEKLLPTLEGLPATLVTLRRDEQFVLKWWEDYFTLALAAFERPSVIHKRCAEVLGSRQCNTEENSYMFEELPKLLADVQEFNWLNMLPLIVCMSIIFAATVYCLQSGKKGSRPARQKAAGKEQAPKAKANSGSQVRKRQGQR